jgi:hypothetical protein
MPLEIALTTSVETMSPEQFAVYARVVQERAANYAALLPAEQDALIAALRAVNKRKASELSETGLDITVRDGNRPAPTGFSLPRIPLWGWALGIAGLALLLGPKR